MDENLQKTLQQRMAELPPEIQAAIQSVDFSKKLQTIGQKYLLHIDQMGTLENEVLLVMLGFVNPDEFVGNVVSEIRVPLATANLLATDVSQELFLPIRESMKKFLLTQNRTPIQPSATSAALQQTTITPAASMPPVQSSPSAAQTKQYTTDPYHEPVE